jgi:hypothetical protein
MCPNGSHFSIYDDQQDYMRAALAAPCLVATLVSQTSTGDLDTLYQARQWFELRETVTDRSPAVLRGAVATAFNEPARAESLLRSIVHDQPRSAAANDAYALLSQIYIRSGQYSRFLRTHREWGTTFSDSSELQREKENVEKFGGRPDQVNGPGRRATLRHEADALSVPVSIDGKTDDFLFDTGAWQSAMTELKARKLGLAIRDGTKVLVGSSGQAATFRTAVAKEVVLGAMRFRNVSFAVIAAEGLFRDVELGVIGMPILLAVGRIRWSKDGTVEIGSTSPPSPSTTPNLVFDRHRLLLRADVLGRQVLTTFDTGANTTDLNANFATLFPDVVARGKKGTQDITGVGGTQSFDSVELPELVVNIGLKSATLRPAYVTLQRIALIGGECCVGNAGHDLLTQGQGFTIDFSTMTLQLH